MAISIKVFLVAVIVVVGVVAATIAFVPLYYSAINAVDGVVSVLRVEIAARIQGGIVQFFSACQSDVTSLMLAGSLGALNASDPYQLLSWFGRMSMNLGGLAVYAGLESGQFVMAQASSASNPSVYVWLTMHKDPSSTLTNDTSLYMYYNVTSHSNSTEMLFEANTYDPTKRPWYAPVFARQSWSEVYMDTDIYAVVTAGGPFVDSNGVKVGALAIDYGTAAVNHFLQQQHVGKTGRVVVVDSGTKGVLGGNWAMSTVVNDSGTLSMAQLEDVVQSDPLAAKVLGSLGSQQLLSCALPCKFDITSSQAVDTIYVDVVAIADQYGLSMRLIQIIPAADYLDAMDKDSKSAIGATAGAVVGLLLVAVIVGQVALEPLSVLEEKLFLASSLSDEVVQPASCNFLSEILRIEEAFDNLQAELKRVKSFVPQSVLQRLEDGDDGAAQRDEVDLFSAGEPEIKSGNSPQPGGARSETDSCPTSQPSIPDPLQAHQKHKRRGSRVVHALNLSGGLTSRPMTLLMVNLCGFHQICIQGLALSEQVHTEYLKIVEACVAAAKGVFDSFSGDHVVVSFNASNTVASHVTRCAAAICAIEHAVQKRNSAKAQSSALQLRLAASTGRALVGNVGTDNIKRFTIVGGIVNQCFALLQLAKLWRLPNLVTAAAMDLMEYEYQVQTTGVALLPPSDLKHVTLPIVASPVGTVVASKKAEDDEWMYQLSASTVKDDDSVQLRRAFLNLELSRRGTDANLADQAKIHAEKVLSDYVEKNPAVFKSEQVGIGYRRLQSELEKQTSSLCVALEALNTS